MGLLKKICDMFDQAWEDYIYDPASLLVTLFEVANIDQKWLNFLKPLLGFTKDMPFEATEAELRRILTKAVPFWNDKPSELGCIVHAIRMVSGARFRIRDWFDYRMMTDETCLTEEMESFDPWCVDFPSKCARNLSVSVYQVADTPIFIVNSGLGSEFQTAYEYRHLHIEEPESLRGDVKIVELLPGTFIGIASGVTWPWPYVDCVASIYGAMDEYTSEIRLVDDQHGSLDFDQETVPFVAGERVRGYTSGARASVMAVTGAGTGSGTLELGRVVGRFVDNETLIGSAGGDALAKGKAYNILNRDLLKFLLEVNRPSSERYDITYINFLEEFETPNDLDQWTHSGAVSAPAPGCAAVIGAGGLMICNDPRAVMVDVDSDGTYDEGWDNQTIWWKVEAQTDLTEFDLIFRRFAVDTYMLIRYSMPAKMLILIKKIGGAETIVDVSAVQHHMKAGVQDVVRVDTFTDRSGETRCRVLLDGDEIIEWQSTPSTAIGGPVGIYCTVGTVNMKLVEVNVWPTEIDRVGLPPSDPTHYEGP